MKYILQIQQGTSENNYIKLGLGDVIDYAAEYEQNPDYAAPQLSFPNKNVLTFRCAWYVPRGTEDSSLTVTLLNYVSA